MAITIPEVTVYGTAPKPTVITLKPVKISAISPKTWKQLGGTVATIALTVVGHDNAVFANETIELSYAAHGDPPTEEVKEYWKWIETITLDGAGTGQLTKCYLKNTGTLVLRSKITIPVQRPRRGYENAHQPLMEWVDTEVLVQGQTFICPSPSDTVIMLQASRRNIQQTSGSTKERTNTEKSGNKGSNEVNFGGQYGPFSGGFKTGEEQSREWGSDEKSGTSTSTPVNLPTQLFDIQVVRGVCVKQ